MNKMFVSRLREGLENKNHIVYAPYGGLFCIVNDVRLGFAESIDLDIDHDGVYSRIRVIPRLDEIVEDPPSSGVYHFYDAIGIFLKENGEETDQIVNLYVSLNTAVTVEDTPMGVLRMSHPTPPE